MTKTEFIAKLATKAGLSKKDAEAYLNAFLETVESELVKGNKIAFTGFGSFEVTDRKARTGRNPRTGEAMEIPASKQVKFKVGKGLKDAVK